MPELSLPHRHGDGRAEEDIIESLGAAEDYQAVSGLFKLMADPSRVRIFWLLCHCEECVINISAMVEMSSPAVSHHLRQLKAGSLIVSRRDGKEVYYKAADTQQSRLLHQTIEETLAVACPSLPGEACPDDRQTCRQRPEPQLPREQADTVRQLHGYLMDNMDRRITIEELSRKYLMNPTTLKAVFKEVYGSSLASHMKRHRLERAAALLRETDQSVLQIANAVGFASQSKFTAAFKSAYQLTPQEYRRRDGRGV